MTANDYANIQRMIDASMEEELQCLEDDLQGEIHDRVSEVARDLDHLQQTVSDLEAAQ